MASATKKNLGATVYFYAIPAVQIHPKPCSFNCANCLLAIAFHVKSLVSTVHIVLMRGTQLPLVSVVSHVYVF